MKYQKEKLLRGEEKILWEGTPERYALFSKVRNCHEINQSFGLMI